MFKKITKIKMPATVFIFLILFLVELLSLCAYLVPEFQNILFLTLAIIAFLISLIKLEYGLLILIAELLVGSLGYLFSFSYQDVNFPIRIALWLIIMSVWFSNRIISTLKHKSFEIAFLKLRHWPYFLALGVFVLWGFLNGFINHNDYNNIFFDFNGWLYFLLIFPLAEVYNTNKSINNIIRVFLAGAAWLAIKTYFLLYIFSHNIIGVTAEIYRWVRDTRVGEITLIQGGFYRIFIQSQSFILIASFIFVIIFIYRLNQLNNSTAEKLERYLRNITIVGLYFTVCFLFSIILISFSRSFWLGIGAGIIFYWIFELDFLQVSLKKFFINNLIMSTAVIGAVLLIMFIVKFPFPNPVGGFNTAALISERAGTITGEAAVSSRWSQIPVLWHNVKNNWILGQGFGATITYRSSDPRVLNSSPGGLYTTYAFEWGWLDIWLKLGIFGVITYLILLAKLIKDGFNLLNKDPIYYGIIIGIGILAAVNFFTPYLNHPLGIGYVIAVSALINNVLTKNYSNKSAENSG